MKLEQRADREVNGDHVVGEVVEADGEGEVEYGINKDMDDNDIEEANNEHSVEEEDKEEVADPGEGQGEDDSSQRFLIGTSGLEVREIDGVIREIDGAVILAGDFWEVHVPSQGVAGMKVIDGSGSL